MIIQYARIISKTLEPVIYSLTVTEIIFITEDEIKTVTVTEVGPDIMLHP